MVTKTEIYARFHKDVSWTVPHPDRSGASVVRANEEFDYFQAREMHIKKQYRNAIKTQTLQYKALQKQILEKTPREKHKELTKQLREEKMRKMADLSLQYDQSISEMLQRQTVSLIVE